MKCQICNITRRRGVFSDKYVMFVMCSVQSQFDNKIRIIEQCPMIACNVWCVNVVILVLATTLVALPDHYHGFSLPNDLLIYS